MILNSDNIKKIKNKEPTFIKKFTSWETPKNFNYIIKEIDTYSLNVIPKGSELALPTFNCIWQVRQIHQHNSFFFTFLDFFKKTFNYTDDIRDSVDIFISFMASVGVSHTDIEDVFLIGLEGTTIYKDMKNDINYSIEKGDLLYFPKGNRHKAISLNSRLIASVGLYGERNV